MIQTRGLDCPCQHSSFILPQGYGLVFPSTSSTVDSDHGRCTGIQILCTFESFVGILFASFCGAIVFGKVARTRSHAQVTFSDPIVVRYGKGLDDDADSDSGSEEEGISRLPCPVLEFRVINRLHSTRGGELMDATMNVVASVDESQACTSVRTAARGRRRKGRRRRCPPAKARAAIPSTVEEQASLPSPISETMDVTLHPIARVKKYQAVDDNIDGENASRRIFTKLELDVPDHPFFKRVWTAAHTLNEHSPLLSNKARRLVRENGGFWPAALNHHEAVRASIHFDQIIVSLSGTLNADANSVYAQVRTNETLCTIFVWRVSLMIASCSLSSHLTEDLRFCRHECRLPLCKRSIPESKRRKPGSRSLICQRCSRAIWRRRGAIDMSR